jgi:multiple sugar transport system substrate-binding protein
MFTLNIFYNADHFKKAGIKNFAKTWPEYVAMLKKLTNGKDQWGYTIRGTDPLWEFHMYLYEAGADFFDASGKLVINNAAGRSAVKFYTDLYTKDKVMPPGTTSYGWDESWNMWKEGKVSCYVGGTWLLGNIRELSQQNPWPFEYWVAKPPAGKKDATMIEECYYTVLKQSKYPKEAVDVIKWLVSKENDLRWGSTISHLPVRQSNMTAVVSKDPIFGPFAEAGKVAVIRPRISYYWEFSQPLSSAIQEVLAGRKTADQAVNEAAPKMQEVVDKYK